MYSLQGKTVVVYIKTALHISFYDESEMGGEGGFKTRMLDQKWTN